MKVIIRATVGAGVERFVFLHLGVDDSKVSASMIVFAPESVAADELSSRRCGRGLKCLRGGLEYGYSLGIFCGYFLGQFQDFVPQTRSIS